MIAQLSNFSSAQDTNDSLVFSLGLDVGFERDALIIELYKGGYVLQLRVDLKQEWRNLGVLLDQ